MPDQVVILFIFAVITSFGIIWLANEMWLNKLSLGVSAAVLLFTVWSVKSYYDGGDVGRFALPFGLLFLVGYIIYVFTAYSTFISLSPYLYFFANGLPIVALWIYHQSQPSSPSFHRIRCAITSTIFTGKQGSKTGSSCWRYSRKISTKPIK